MYYYSVLQDLRRQNEELSVTVEACSVECEELITKRDQMQVRCQNYFSV